jgi:hypothetical protein
MTDRFFRSKEEKQQRLASQKTERRVASQLRGRTQPNSGATAFVSKKGDVAASDFLFELKETAGSTLSLSTKVVAKIHQEAIRAGKRPALHLLVKGMDGPIPSEWVMLTYDDWLHIWELLSAGE